MKKSKVANFNIIYSPSYGVRPLITVSKDTFKSR